MLGGDSPKHQGKEREYVFTEDTMDRLAKLYGDTPEVQISLKKPSAPDPTPMIEDHEKDLYSMMTIIQVRREVNN